MNSTIQSDNFTKKIDLQTNWFKANHHCTWNGMRLATILSQEENNQVKAQINETRKFQKIPYPKKEKLLQFKLSLKQF